MILMNEFKREPLELRQAELAAFARVQDSGWYILGEENERFGASLTKFSGARHAIGVANGLDAIEVLLRACGIGAGDEVITTGLTAFATILGVLRTGATPVLVDIDPSTGCIDPDRVAKAITKRTKAVLPVHLYGRLCRMDELQAICGSRNLHLIEDCAQAVGARIGPRHAGAFGIGGAFSFYPTKNLGALGDAGAILTSDDALAETCGILRNYGQSERYHHPVRGTNSRLDEVQAALLTVRLQWLDEWTVRRRVIAQSYWERISNERITLLAEPEVDTAHVHHLFVVLCNKRDQLQAHLMSHEIQTHIHYPIPAQLQRASVGVVDVENDWHATALHANRCLSLPCHPYMTDSEVDAVVEAVNKFSH